jgi:Ca-activated chloride channel family protein
VGARAAQTRMIAHLKGSLWVIFSAVFLALLAWLGFHPESASAATTGGNAGSLEILGKDGKITNSCPLKHTDVRGAISGFVARVTVTQIFENPSDQNIEAVYVFPLPDDAAVDDMTIQIGDRTVRSLIKKREDARAIYEKAKATGHVAALLDQERPNIFTQSVANILPGEQVKVTISYLQTLPYEAGSYQFVFPMVVGPRYIPGNATGKQAGGWANDTGQVPDASRITPKVAAPGTRAGHDISIELAIDAGVPIQNLHSILHDVDVDQPSANIANVKLRNENEIPNKDFVLKYQVAGEKIQDAILSQAAPKGSKLGPGGYFTLILQPPARVKPADVTPKELVFVLDTSGSMWGFPLDKAKELVNKALDELYPGDTFNLITFSGDTQVLFPEPVYPTAENLRIARNFLKGRSGGGGTEMMKAIRAALDPSDAQDHIRIVCFITDGYVGNDMEILGEIQKHPNARVFSFGIGDSVNRFLIEGMAKEGRGDSEVVTLNDKADEAAHRLYERLHAPLLTDISIDWNGLPVTDVYPKKLPDLFSGKPLVVTGRYTAAAKGTIRLKGNEAGDDPERDIAVNFTANSSDQNTLATFWARRKIDELMSQDWSGLQTGNVKPDVQKEITQLGLDYRLMTQFTSFVAVEDRVVTTDGVPKTVQVPVEMPNGVDYEHVFGTKGENVMVSAQAGMVSSTPLMSRAYSGGSIAGFAGGAMKSAPLPAPPRVTNAETAQLDASVSEDKDERQPGSGRSLLESKLHPTLLAAFDCWKKSGTNCKTAPDGKATVVIFLTTSSPQVMQQLTTLGVEVTEQRSADNSVVGKLALDKLESLAKLPQVRFVTLSRH